MSSNSTQEEDIAENEAFIRFMEGYKRPPKTVGLFFSALAKAMDKYPNMRVGQLIFNALETHYSRLAEANGKEYNGMAFRTSFHSYLFNAWDEDLIKALEEF